MQIAPVVSLSNPLSSAKASFKLSPLWTPQIKKITLTKNYRIHRDPEYATDVTNIGKGIRSNHDHDSYIEVSPYMHSAIITKIPTKTTYSEEDAIRHAFPNLYANGKMFREKLTIAWL